MGETLSINKEEVWIGLQFSDAQDRGRGFSERQ
jgi:hypothetical protein